MAEPKDMMASLDITMKQRTGRSTREWVELIEATPQLDPLDQKAVRAWLKATHGVPQNSQWAIAHAAATDAGWVEPDVEGYTDQLYSGKKAAARPLHDAVLALALSAGENARAEGRSTYIPVVNRLQFAVIAPGPRNTLRVGVRFRETPADLDPRFAPVKNFAQATHAVDLPLDEPAEPNALSWLVPVFALAYSQNA